MPDTLETLIHRFQRQGLTPAQVRQVMAEMPEHVISTLLADSGAVMNTVPKSPVEQARELDPGYVTRPHLTFLSDRLTAAAERREAGLNARLATSMPPRMGKSTMISTFTPLWLLRRDPTLKIGLISHNPTLATGWAKTIRKVIENNPGMGIAIPSDSRGQAEWETTQGGSVTARSTGESIVGRGFNVLIVDDVVRDFAAAHSDVYRRSTWEWWTANAYTRLEPPFMVLAVGTRWHEDDFIGRLLSPEYEGDPRDWEVISFPALAETADVLGRAEGEPLLTPLNARETPELALARWAETKQSVGGYNWAAQYQQRPAPPMGAIFNIGWFRYWTTNPLLATDDGKVKYVDFDALLGADWVDSWDMAFKKNDDTDYVVGQRWCRHGGNRYLVDQVRDRMSFTQSLTAVREFRTRRYSDRTWRSLIEDKANGPAIIDFLHDEMSGLTPVEPYGSKEARAAAVSPEVESGNVYLPLPAEHPWVTSVVDELRAFPTGAHDDTVDTLTQALFYFHAPGVGHVSSLTDRPPIAGSRFAAARSMGNRLGR